MSVSDPLIKDIKGSTLNFLNQLKTTDNISESCNNLEYFCQLIEKIFYSGLKSTCNALGFMKYVVPWGWLEEIGEESHYLITFPYKNSIDQVKQQKHVTTNIAKFRLLIRHFLVYKCLHIPIQYLLNTKKYVELYKDSAILGDEILLQILLSVILQYSNITFKLDLKNSTFLDISWQIPDVINLELVPSESLGLSVSFAGDKAVIVGIRSNSVISETGKAEVGDVLDNLNGINICRATKGKLQSIFNLSKGKPILCNIIKATYTNTKEIYLPVVPLLKQVQIDPDILKSRFHESTNENTSGKLTKSGGFRVKYVGSAVIGSRGDVKLIDKGAKAVLTSFNDKNKGKNKITDVYFEIGELGVKVVDKLTSVVLLKHSYMEISSCGSVHFLPNYFAYVAGDQCCNVASNFTCYLFNTDNNDTGYTILQSIGQGFHRTHFAV